MRAMILSAGLGTRLWPLTDAIRGVPKPCVPVANRPLAAFAFESLAAHGIDEAAMNAHHHGDKLLPLLEPVLPTGMSMQVAHEPSLLGTGGGVRNMAELLSVNDDETLIVSNSDIVFAPDLAAAVKHHQARDAYATMLLRPDPKAALFGAISVDEEGLVRAILGRPQEVSQTTKDMMFTGVHVLSGRAARDLPEHGCIVQQGYRRWLDEGRAIAGYVEHSPWHDLGTLKAYLDVNVALATGALPWEGLSRVGVVGDSWVDPSAEVGGELEMSVVCAGANHRFGRARRCIITPHGHVSVR